MSEYKNIKIIKEFNKLVEQIKFEINNMTNKTEKLKNTFRLKQIKNVLEIIKKFPNEITSSSDLKNIKGVGKGSLERVDEILKTGKLSEIKITGEHRKYIKYMEELEEIIGIGRSTSYELVTAHNIKNVEELKKAYDTGKIKLPNQIILGLKYHNVYKQSIPRHEIDKIYNYVNGIIRKIDSELLIIICGSYRRLKSTSNDIDILLTHPKIKTKQQLIDQDHEHNNLLKMVTALKKHKFLLDDLTDKDFEMKYMGFCKLENNPIRRIDIRYIPYESYYTALLYFTGSGTFNQKMRALAEKLGYLLNEYGLYKLNGDKIISVTIKSEKDIFDKLGMEYLPPEKRN
jgi:DNA polymerase/3'-5' exonuclease PolX